MKRNYLILGFFAFALCLVSAQQGQGQGPGGPPMPPTPEEEVAMWSKTLNLNGEQEAQFLTVLTNSAEKMKSLMEGGQRPDRETMMALMTERDEQLKACLNADQISKMQEAIEARHNQQGQGNQGPPQG
ncbi:MAG: hypothetical protein PQJ60_08870 [Spirochaetales bacterium]|nr:hypothetical protein [Spirochaetales bacterium]